MTSRLKLPRGLGRHEGVALTMLAWKKGGVAAFAVATATMLACSAADSVAPVALGPGVPVFDASNPNYVLHVFEDWSTYSSPAAINTTNRVDGGGSWHTNDPSKQSFATDNNDPWFGKKTVNIDLQDVPTNLVHQRGFTLTQNSGLSPARFLNELQAKESLVIEWAVRQEGPNIYSGKIADWQPQGGLYRFNFQGPIYDRLGDRDNATCDSDALCNRYYSGNGTSPRSSGLSPSATYEGYQFARSFDNTKVVHWLQNRHFGSGPGLFDPKISEGPPPNYDRTSQDIDNVWRRYIIRLTLNQPGTSAGHGRVEQWMQKAGEPAVKTMEYVGDIGGFDAGLVHTGPNGARWINDGSTLYWYNLTSQVGMFDGGNTLHLGYIRIWSMPRE